MKISEHPTEKVHRPSIQREVVREGDTARAAESSVNSRMVSEELPSPRDPQLGTLMVREGLITDSQLQEALRAQSELDVYKPVGQILVDQKAVSGKQLNLFIDKYHKRARLGEILVKSKTITGEQLEIALSYQKTSGLPIEEMLIKLNYINEETMRQVLCKHLNIPYIDLDQFTIDLTLRKLINKSYAKNNRVVPIANLGNTITLALEDPTNTGVVKELRSSTGLTINVVTSTGANIRHTFAQLYGEELHGEQEEDYDHELISEEELSESGKSRYLEEYHKLSSLMMRFARSLI